MTSLPDAPGRMLGGRIMGALLAPAAMEYLHALAIQRMVAHYKGFNEGLDVGRHIFGPWDVRDPFADMKPSHAGVRAFRSVFP